MSLYIPFEKGYGTYAGTVRTSRYVEGSDGTKLAVDIYLPADGPGEAAPGPFPLVLHAAKGGRRMGTGIDAITSKLVANGYAHMFLETRGSGASYGYSKSFCEPLDARDVAAVIEWAAVQPWCNGKVGMRGISNSGLIQEATAAVCPEHLVAIAPVVCNSDFYSQNYPNGVPLEPGVPAKLEFCIDPISYVFAAGHSIRVTLVCAEEKTYQQPEGFDYENPPTITLYTGGDKASLVKLPLSSTTG